ncbi:MAG: carbon-nitrogen hydrolase family protein [Candidatus Magnetoglobus multicellularis str. Araruama]|uniref:Carbon-nitrogen hydrolase family protein n=1 Tax=Candidatus Magnetoglobus multicellularis str. Araruama TaxID=890399 RepID=A0A1V1P8V6_9BACT|nr:MAG: carbon-nitrogen hydrolase family protein [Candidatus Magnetoglobus multicellularis str. Araruama]
MKIASIQMDIAWENKQENLRKAAQFIHSAKNDGCDIVVFPELFNVGFSMNINAFCEPGDGHTVSKLCELAKQFEINVIAGYPEKANTKARNVAISINRNGIVIGRYIKNHPFSFAHEDEFYEPGNNLVVFELDHVRCSMFICYDLRFPELFRMVAKNVALIFVIANWPEVRQHHWESLLKARAIENQCFIIGVNRTGKDGNDLIYAGGSHVYHPTGESLSRGGKNQTYLVTELNIDDVANVRKEFPFLEDMKYI